jgi:hypothetical protein
LFCSVTDWQIYRLHHPAIGFALLFTGLSDGNRLD